MVDIACGSAVGALAWRLWVGNVEDSSSEETREEIWV